MTNSDSKDGLRIWLLQFIKGLEEQAITGGNIHQMVDAYAVELATLLSPAPKVDPASLKHSADTWQPYSEAVKLHTGYYYWIYNAVACIVQKAQYGGKGTDKEALWLTEVGTIYNKYVSHYSEQASQPNPPTP